MGVEGRACVWLLLVGGSMEGDGAWGISIAYSLVLRFARDTYANSHYSQHERERSNQGSQQPGTRFKLQHTRRPRIPFEPGTFLPHPLLTPPHTTLFPTPQTHNLLLIYKAIKANQTHRHRCSKLPATNKKPNSSANTWHKSARK